MCSKQIFTLIWLLTLFRKRVVRTNFDIITSNGRDFEYIYIYALRNEIKFKSKKSFTTQVFHI